MSGSDLEETSSGSPQPARFRAQQDKKGANVVRRMSRSLGETGPRQRPRPMGSGGPLECRARLESIWGAWNEPPALRRDSKEAFIPHGSEMSNPDNH